MSLIYTLNCKCLLNRPQYVKTDEQLRKDLEEAEKALKTSVTLARGEPRTLETLSHDRIDIEFISTPEMSSFQFEAIVFLEWRNGGLVTYSCLEADCFQGHNSTECQHTSQ